MIGIDSMGSYIYRAFCILLLAYLFFLGILQRKFTKLPRYTLPILIFSFIIYVRVMVDVLVRGIKFYEQDDSFFILFFIHNTISAVFVFCFLLESIDFSFLGKWLFISLLISNLQLLYYVANEIGFSSALFQNRIVVRKSDETEGFILNPITFALVGQQLTVISISHLLFNHDLKEKKYLYYLSLTIGFILLVLGGSRGPMLNTFLVLSFFLLVKNIKTKSLMNLFKYFIITIVIILILITFIDPQILESIEAFRRIITTVDNINNTDNEERVFEYAAAWNQFLENPLIGDQFVNNFDSYHAHNIFLEVLMATGLVGAFFFFFFIRDYFKAIYKIFFIDIPPSILSIYAISITIFLLGLTSGTLYLNLDLWLSLLAVIGYSKRYQQNLSH
ncbi:O-antigen ligase family protein [Runella sp. MFBS21]|uniref:O-antigen ligase family protein n=1 Tax=Runella sp. MFBS21 TaxID=3034018 RepID=UPI0023F724F2|nr:O-antigen ligase family protein [Runella sp. MFBS21]MDF7820176.1 O-antigen ligase family protein [Runella sp. MFBS21]